MPISVAVRVGRHADDWTGPRLVRPTPVGSRDDAATVAAAALFTFYAVGYAAALFPWWVVAVDGEVWRQGPAGWLDPLDWGGEKPVRRPRKPKEPPPWRPPAPAGGSAW